ncbi:MAG: hypothetical protein M0Q54_06700 [Pigmentiphaga sp.]|nr:hypothetical protein [Pigmentiphaga sp.]
MFEHACFGKLWAGAVLLASAMATPVVSAQEAKLDKAVFYIGWRAEAEFGGFFPGGG